MSIFSNIANAVTGVKWATNNNWNNPDDATDPNNKDLLHLAGLAVLGGANPGDAIKDATEYQRQRKLDQATQQLGTIMKDIDPSDPYQAIGNLAAKGIPIDMGIKIVQAKTEQQKQAMNQTMLQSLFGGATPGQPAASMPTPAPAVAAGQEAFVTQPDAPITAGPIGTQSGLAPLPPAPNQPAMSGPNPMALNAAAIITGNPGYSAMASSVQKQQEQVDAKESGDRKYRTDNEQKLWDDFAAKSKPYETVRDGFANIRNAYKSIKADPKNAGVGDIQMVYGVMKVLDPSSTVREGEYATQSNAGGVPDWVRARWNKLQSGDVLSPDVRDRIFTLSEKNYNQAISQHDKLRTQFTKRAKSYGLNPENVAYDITATDEPKGGDKPAASATPAPPAKIISFTQRAKQAGYTDAEIAAAIKAKTGGK